MHQQPVPIQTAPAPAYDQLLERVRYEGAYPTRERAEEVVHAVLAALGRQLAGTERAELAACLPRSAARVLTSQTPASRPLAARDFVQDLAERTGAGQATARWDCGSVLAAVATLAGPALLTRLLAQLPSGYALLFGRAELTAAA